MQDKDLRMCFAGQTHRDNWLVVDRLLAVSSLLCHSCHTLIWSLASQMVCSGALLLSLGLSCVTLARQYMSAATSFAYMKIVWELNIHMATSLHSSTLNCAAARSCMLSFSLATARKIFASASKIPSVARETLCRTAMLLPGHNPGLAY